MTSPQSSGIEWFLLSGRVSVTLLGEACMRGIPARACFYFTAAAVLVLSAVGQGASSDYPYWYDVPSAPLKFDIPPRDLRYAEGQMLHIRSTSGVVRAYSLGCVRVENGVALGTETMRTWQLNQRPEDQFFPINTLRITAIPCGKRSERLAVVKVEYADGGVWELSIAPAHGPVPETK